MRVGEAVIDCANDERPAARQPLLRGLGTELFSLFACLFGILYRRMKLKSAWISALVVIALTLLVGPPDIHRLAHWRPNWQDRALDWKIQHPLSEIPTAQFVEPNDPTADGIVSHLHKRTFRVLIPVVAHGLQMDKRGADVLNVLFSLAFLVVVLLYLRREIPDSPLVALLLTVSLACSLVGEWGLAFPGGWEPVAYLLLALAVYVENPYLIFLFVVMGGLEEERAIIAIPLVYLMHGGSLFTTNRKRYAILAGVGVFVLLRILLALHLGQMYESSGLSWNLTFYNSIASPMYFVTTFKGALLILVVGFAALFHSDRRKALALFFCTLPGLLSALSVGDVSKSLIYLFPAFLICAVALCRNYDEKQVLRYATVAAAISACLPTYYWWLHGFAHIQNAWQRVAAAL